MSWTDHLVIAPVIIPLVAGGAMLLFEGRRREVVASINVLATLAQLAVAIALRRRCVAPQDALLVVFMLAFWSFPLVVGAAVSPYRAESLLLPSAVLSRHLPAPAQAVLTAAAVILAYPMVLLFYRGVLV